MSAPGRTQRLVARIGSFWKSAQARGKEKLLGAAKRTDKAFVNTQGV